MKKLLFAAAVLFAIAGQPFAAPVYCSTTPTVQPSAAVSADTGRRYYTRLKKEVRSRLRQLDVLYNKPFYTKEFIYTIDTRDMALLRTRAFFMDLFEKHPEAHDTSMLLQHLGMLSSRKKH
jgi:hypothetical protein